MLAGIDRERWDIAVRALTKRTGRSPSANGQGESYVDLAANHVKASMLAAAHSLSKADEVSDADLEAKVAEESDAFKNFLHDFLQATVMLTRENSAHLLLRAEELKVKSLDAVREVRQQQRKATAAVQAKVVKDVTLKFDRELEVHQTRMSQRFLECRDVMGDKLSDVRTAKVRQAE